MPSFNQITLLGRFGKEPEFQFTPNGTPVCKCSLAVDDFVNGGKTTQWFNLVFWQKQAETVEKYLSMGSQVLVTGKMTSRKWKDSNDNQRETWEVTVNTLQMLDSKQKNEQQRTRGATDNDFLDNNETDFGRLLASNKGE